MTLMCYTAFEQYRTMLGSCAAWMHQTSQLVDDLCPFEGPLPMRMVRATALVGTSLTRAYPKPEFGIRTVATFCGDAQIVERIDDSLAFCSLRHFHKVGVPAAGPKVLLFAPLSGHYATLLRETVAQLLIHHDVFVTDWANARDVPLEQGAFGFDDYVGYSLRFMARHPDAAVVCVCQPSAPVFAAVCLQAQRTGTEPSALVLLAGPMDTRISPTAVNRYAKRHPVAWHAAHAVDRVPDGYVGAQRLVYPGFVQHAAFVSMNMARHLYHHGELFWSLTRGDMETAQRLRGFYDEYNAVMDLPAEFYLQTLERVFCEHWLPEGRLAVDGQPVDAGALTRTRLLCIEGEIDDICGRGQTAAALRMACNLPASHKAGLVVQGAGHYGVFSGRRFREQCYPVLREFIADSVAKRSERSIRRRDPVCFGRRRADNGHDRRLGTTRPPAGKGCDRAIFAFRTKRQ